MLQSNQDELDQSQLLARIGGGLSVFGSLSVFAIYFFFSSSRSSANRLFLFVSLSDLLNAVAFIMAEVPSNDPYGIVCQLCAFLIEAFCISSVFWGGIMALNLLLSIHVTKTTNAIVRYEYLYHIAVWSLSIIPALLMIFIRPNGNHIYGPSSTSAWCTITDDFNTLRIVIFYVPMWSVFFFALISYIMVGAMMVRTHRLHTIEQRPGSSQLFFLNEGSVLKNVHLQRYFRASSVYILAIFFAWGPATVNRLYQLITNSTIETLVLVRAFLTSGSGFLNFLAYLIVLLDLWGWKRKKYSLRKEAENDFELAGCR